MSVLWYSFAALGESRAADPNGGIWDMTGHACPRCGFNSSHDGWPDRHPVAAVLFALPAGYTIIGVILAYPWFFVPLLVVVCALQVDRRNRRRASIAARAEHEHRALIAHAVFSTRAQLPRRAADQWSTTEPIRIGRIERERSAFSQALEIAALQMLYGPFGGRA